MIEKITDIALELTAMVGAFAFLAFVSYIAWVVINALLQHWYENRKK